MKTVPLGLLAIAAAAAPAMATLREERFAPVVIVAGQGVTVNVANVLVPPPNRACPVDISFFAGDGTQIGTTRSLELQAGASASAPAPSLQPGLVRVVVSVADPARGADCAVKADVEVFSPATGAGRLIVPGMTCIGLGACATELKP